MSIKLVRSRPGFFAGVGAFALAAATQSPLFPPAPNPARAPRELLPVAQPAELGVSLTEVGKLNTPGMISSFAFGDGRLYASMSLNGVAVVNIEDPARPRFEGRLLGLRDLNDTGGRVALAVEPISEGREALICDRRRGLGVYDLSDPRQPFFVRTQAIPGGVNDRAISITTFGGRHYLACGAGGLRSLPVGFTEQTPSKRILKHCDYTTRSVFYPPHWLLASDGHDGGMRVIDISDPDQPRLACTFQPGTYCDQIIPMGRYVVMGARAFGLMIIDMRNPERPRLANQTFEVTRGDVAAIALWRDRFMVVGHRTPHIDVFDLIDPERPRIISRLPIREPVTALETRGNLLYVGLRERITHETSEPPSLMIYQLAEVRR